MSNTGGGHKAAAEAVAAELRDLSPDVTVDVVDVIEELSGFWHAVVGLYGPIVRRAPWLWGALFGAFGGASRAPLWHAFNAVAVATVRHRFLAYVDQKRPDAVLSTHPLINQGAHAARMLYRRERGRHIPFAVVVTDPVTFHAAWIEPAADVTFVATPEARQRAVACGLEPARVRVTGLPLHPAFFRDAPPRDKARSELGIPPDAPVVLCCGGGEGLKGLAALARALLSLPAQPVVLAVAGRDSSSESALRREPDARLQVFGFTRQMPLLMAAADVVVTKAGPATLFEALALGKPVVVVDAIPGQEAGNVELVRAHALGRVAMDSTEEAVAAVEQLLGDPTARAVAADNGRKLSRPDAAREIARWLLQQAGGMP
jgi:1,2-diacylglycerol 3-beta-galactosyltransferase